ncbi:MAG: sigma-54-dependent Fis family transcriptional regulator, partial [Aquificaceae bacterium]|nr:sigma-54-dependent Fis family transcriptional regulator [Aquificaceae bacterium]
KIRGVSSEAMRLLLSYSFPGNVRELENMIERAVITCKGSLVNPEDIELDTDRGIKAQEEKEKILRVLEQTGGNRSLAARMLGIHRTTLWRKLKELGIS